MSLFCLAVSSEASLPAQKTWTFYCTETSDYTTKTKFNVQLFDAQKLTQSHCAGEPESDPRAPDEIAAQLYSNKPLHLEETSPQGLDSYIWQKEKGKEK